MYDALSRLLRAKNPEQAANASLGVTDPVTGNSSWSLGFAYDGHGNLQSRTDARGVVTAYTYDNLNRQTGITYQNDPANTPAVSLFYDNQPNARGALWKVATADHYTETLNRDDMGRPRTNRQAFNNGLWRFYDTTYTYSLAGQILTQTYPSGRNVSYQYDDAGRPFDFRGTLGDGALRVYSTGVQYDEAGRMRQEQFGTQVPVFNKSFYNVRGQLSEIRVSTFPLSAPGEATNWNRGAIINHYSDQSWAGSGTDNDGNLKKQDIYIPDDDAISGYSLKTQQYFYDALNRLDWVREFGGGPDRVQDYDYDRYGNRTVNAANTSNGIPKPQFAVDANTNRLGVPAGQTGVMQYDAAGNLTADTYSASASTRRYDGENHLYEEMNASNQQTGRYTYDGAGRRVRRAANGQETWYVYGLGGELVAEYAAGFTGASAQQEYGYRGGELLVTASPYGEQGLKADYFNSLDFTGAALTRTDATVDFEWHGASPGAGVGADNFTARWTGYVTPRFTETYTFYTQSDDGVRLWVDGQLVVDKWVDQGWTEWSGQITLQANRRYEIKMEFYERWGGAIAKLLWASASQPKEVVPASRLTPPGGSPVRWLVRDQLGTPRMTIDQTGGLSKMTRHDYLPFGEELKSGVGGRTIEQGYQADGVRQQFTGHERDSESGLDFMQARHYSNGQGRFTSVDAVAGAAADPRSLNLYAYVLGNPLRYSDPTGNVPAAFGWSSVANNFWGGSVSQGAESAGAAIMRAREGERGRGVKARLDGILAQAYLDDGNWAAARDILTSNPDVGLYVDGEAVWGASATEVVGAVQDRINEGAAKIISVKVRVIDQAPGPDREGEVAEGGRFEITVVYRSRVAPDDPAMNQRLVFSGRISTEATLEGEPEEKFLPEKSNNEGYVYQARFVFRAGNVVPGNGTGSASGSISFIPFVYESDSESSRSRVTGHVTTDSSFPKKLRHKVYYVSVRDTVPGSNDRR